MHVEKIHDVQRHLEGNESIAAARRWPRLIGVINPRAIRIIAFILISSAVIACAVVCIMAVWGSVEPVFAWRSLGSLGIISAATAVFVSLNEGFGPAVRG
jgi:hypothetical protein